MNRIRARSPLPRRGACSHLGVCAPLAPDDIFFDKARRNAQYSLASHRVERLLEIVAELETVKDVRLMTRALTGGVSTHGMPPVD